MDFHEDAALSLKEAMAMAGMNNTRIIHMDPGWSGKSAGTQLADNPLHSP